MSNTDNAVDNQRLETLAIHAGYTVEPTTKAVAVPIYHTSSYAFDDTQHGADLFDLKVAGNIYTRIMNPTNAVLEERVAALEGGIGALAVASGMAAITYAVQTICEVGDNIIAASTLYGGTYNFFAHTLPRQGIEVRFFDHKNPAAIHDLVDEKTKMVFAESIGNPLANIIDIEALAEAAHQHGVPVVIDNTVATPALCRPFEFGADIVVHSLTKYMSGTGTSIGGAIVDSGNFNWGDYPERFPILNQPDVSYHGVNFVKDVGAAAYIARARVAPLRNTGAALSPLNAFSILQGIQTLSLRMERHVQNAQAVAEYLKGHDKVAWVKYAGLSDHPDHQLAQKYMKGTPSAILTFGVKGGREAGAKFIDALNLITRLVNIGDAKSLASHPATTTHRQLNEEELAKAGVSEDMIRLSIGIEHIEDIKADLEQALAKA
ncbi:O-acetylhomoserine aminocarboxypropyltransferase/cysteine synthase family protein [Psychrobacter sanguinis]|uniref:O-acetylhomoserine aminocarboxypropyltransferase/cysteine synthase family protein n=1 Tax=Psychrobacter sanguinis TaxID=861445 RepID=UPI00020C7B2B|nr:aminotransferase class I/II-fold pyridoxal phosphate-dependent enzyme [Psychrobacter sanguinis]EGK09553.1 O-acetylhomoserine sulfhydrylase [Psychrobacter sp. 1501(2011)]MCD9152379.1 aminotransferase class I/II-fold pyridoxal phosphate-dependent enzyme [Psychrobacter sanguinis]